MSDGEQLGIIYDGRRGDGVVRISVFQRRQNGRVSKALMYHHLV